MTCPACGKSLGVVWLLKPTSATYRARGAKRCGQCSTLLRLRLKRWAWVVAFLAILAAVVLGILVAEFLGLVDERNQGRRDPGAFVGGLIAVLLTSVLLAWLAARFGKAERVE